MSPRDPISYVCYFRNVVRCKEKEIIDVAGKIHLLSSFNFGNIEYIKEEANRFREL